VVALGLGGDAVEQPAQAGVELAVVGGSGQGAGELPQLGEAVLGQAGVGRLRVGESVWRRGAWKAAKPSE
jgi:hypothetical protein